jgi:hypothetical protein
MTISLTAQGLLDFLKEQKLSSQFDENNNQIASAIAIGGKDYPLFLKFDTETGVLQLLLFLPFVFDQNAVNDVARVLHLFNKEIDMPGFGMDEANKAIFYRYVVSAKNGEIDSQLLERFLKALPNVGYAFFPMIASIANRNITFEVLLKKMKRK